MRLPHRTTFTLRPRPPFHFDGTFHKPSHFPDQLSDWEPGKFWQTMRVGKRLVGIVVKNAGTLRKPKLRVSVYSKTSLTTKERKSVREEILWRNELDKDLSEFNRLVSADKRFFPVFKKWLGMRNATSDGLYELLIIGVLLQNATVRRTVQMMNALLASFGTKAAFDGKTLYALWKPERLKNVSEQKLRALKIGYRAKFLKRLSQGFAEGRVEETRLRALPKREVKQELEKLYGVGPETARILLFEVFHRNDVFDHIAPWQQKVYSRLFYGKRLIPAERIRKDIVRAYGKYAMLAVHYIWEDVFWRRRHEHIPWLEREIRL